MIFTDKIERSAKTISNFFLPTWCFLPPQCPLGALIGVRRLPPLPARYGFRVVPGEGGMEGVEGLPPEALEEYRKVSSFKTTNTYIHRYVGLEHRAWALSIVLSGRVNLYMDDTWQYKFRTAFPNRSYL